MSYKLPEYAKGPLTPLYFDFAEDLSPPGETTLTSPTDITSEARFFS